LARLVGATTRVAVAQNGVEHLGRFAGVAPRRGARCSSSWTSAERSGPGRIRQRRHGDITVQAG
ncbi:MAG: 2-dehydropantoate 2-reductase N-terminal domain-containing protein, partial [Polyangiaceae bacterium]